MPKAKPSVTIAIPTYCRPELLERALTAATSQTYDSIKICIGDNATPGDDNERLVARFRAFFPAIEYHKHPTNIGPRGNFFHLLDAADTPYFMWLADDDEISPRFVEELVDILEGDPATVTAAGNWFWLQHPDKGVLMPSPNYASPSRLGRVARYIWKADDAFFYGLHRTEILRRANFSGYSWPNRTEVMNWAYVYLLDLVLAGKVVVHPDADVRFINHDYTTKTYPADRERLTKIMRYLARRANVHVLYIKKIAAVGGIALALCLLPVSLISLFHELFAEARRSARDRFVRLFNTAEDRA